MAPYFLSAECPRLSTELAFSVVVIHVAQETVMRLKIVKKKKVAAMQLIDDRNPCRNAAKVTAGIQKQHGWGGCEGADGSELGLGKAWLTGKLCSRRKEKTVWGGKN